MKPVLALLPTVEITQKIFLFRKYCVDNNLAQIDPRLKVLPHLTLVYIENSIDTSKLKFLAQSLGKKSIPPIALPIADIQSWDNKISLMFNKKLLAEQIISLQSQYDEVGIQYEKVNWNLLDMKIVRQVLPNQIENVKEIVKLKFLKTIVFDNRVLLDDDGKEILDEPE